ncbi:MAG: cytochrome c oxidase assembly protein [Candidatus Pelagibacter sp.]
MKKNTLTPLILSGIFVLMLGLSFAAVPLYDLFCRVTGFGGTTQVAKEAPKIVLDEVISVRLDTNVNGNLAWNFKAEKKLLDVKPGKVYNIDFEVENIGNEPSAAVASYNVSPSSFGQYFNKLGCFCFEKQVLNPGEKAVYKLVFYLDPELVNDPKTANIEDVTMSYTFFSSDYYKQSKNLN